MKCSLVKPSELGEPEIAAWAELQQFVASTRNPCFNPLFTQIVANHRPDVEVAIMEDDEKYVGFFPFHRNAANIGLPIGLSLTEMHGVIAHPAAEWSAMDLLKRCNLKSWKFDHLIADQVEFADFHYDTDPSPFMDVSDGYDGYTRQRKEHGSKIINNAQRKLRKLVREVGPIQFHLRDENTRTLQTLIKWKRQQVTGQGFDDIFRDTWVIDFLEEIHATRMDTFEGIVSTLYAGGELIAGIIGMKGNDVYSSWIPVYNPAYAKFSPGLLLHLEIAKSASHQHISRIDLGRGENQMKYGLMTGSILLALGAVDSNRLQRLKTASRFYIRAKARTEPFRSLRLAAKKVLGNALRHDIRER